MQYSVLVAAPLRGTVHSGRLQRARSGLHVRQRTELPGWPRYSRTMTRIRRPLNPLGSTFDRFLYAHVGDDRHGGLLSVISALARAGVDPWEQAAILARLPVDSAARTLSGLLARLPAGPGKPMDPVVLAARLVALLPPAEGRTAPRPVVSRRGIVGELGSWLLRALIFLTCALLFLVGLNLARHPAAAASGAAATSGWPE
jgi:hypothetical protein